MTDVVAALIWDQDKFMICQRPAHKARGLLWEFVVGKTEPGESMEEALVRECREELDITVEGKRIILQKYEPGCVFCNHGEGLVIYNGKHICARCQSAIKELD